MADETYHTPLDVLVRCLDHLDTPLSCHSRLTFDPRPRKPLRYVQHFQKKKTSKEVVLQVYPNVLTKWECLDEDCPLGH